MIIKKLRLKYKKSILFLILDINIAIKTFINSICKNNTKKYLTKIYIILINNCLKKIILLKNQKK